MRATQSRETARVRLLEAAKQAFAKRGFEDVTVRDICRAANANLALVNYHFGDKLGLYLEVVEEAIQRISSFNALTMQPPRGEQSSAQEKLEHFVRTMLRVRIQHLGSEVWIHGLMQHEMLRPTEAAARIARATIAPRVRYLASIIAELLDCPVKDPRVLRCVSSVHGLCLVYLRMVQMPEAFRRAVAEFSEVEPLDVDRAADHVIAFSLAGIREVSTRRTTAAASGAVKADRVRPRR
ncbi:MAG TPA: CerR family C-terminal domain-containing protein [Gemmatimonadaceae bacterium]|jgi:AcrR family transcriptional regulator